MGKKPNIQTPEVPAEAKDISGEYHYAVGRRKSAVATVRLYPKGKGRIVVNNKMLADYFPSPTHQTLLTNPLTETSLEGKCDVTVVVSGGGLAGQADAVRLGVARALIKMNEELRPVVKAKGFLTRDSRKKERKKPGLKRARRRPQWSKR